MVREHGNPAAHRQRVDRLIESIRKNLEFLIHLDADRLERALRGMPSCATGRSGNRVPHDLGQLGGRAHWATRNDRVRDSVGKALVTELPEYAGQFVDAVAVHDIRGAGAGGGIHAHVERAVKAIREPTVSLVELVGRDAEVEQHTGH